MPPGPLYNWLCVAHSVCDVLSHAAYIRAAQVASVSNAAGSSRNDLSRAARPQETPVRALPGTVGGKPVHTAIPVKDHSIASTASQAPAASVASVVGAQQDGEVIHCEETEYMRRHRGDLMGTRPQPVHRPALQPDFAQSSSPVEQHSSTSSSPPSRSASSATQEQHTSPSLATARETSSAAPTSRPTFHEPVPHASTISTQNAITNNSVIMMSAEDPSREVLDKALAKEASPVIGTTSEVPAHDVPSMTGTPELAEPVRSHSTHSDDEPSLGTVVHAHASPLTSLAVVQSTLIADWAVLPLRR